MNKAYKIFNDVLGASGIAVSIQNLNQLLNLACLVLSIIVIITNFILTLKSKSNEKGGLTAKDVAETTNETLDKIEQVNQNYNKK